MECGDQAATSRALGPASWSEVIRLLLVGPWGQLMECGDGAATSRALGPAAWSEVIRLLLVGPWGQLHQGVW